MRLHRVGHQPVGTLLAVEPVGKKARMNASNETVKLSSGLATAKGGQMIRRPKPTVQSDSGTPSGSSAPEARPRR